MAVKRKLTKEELAKVLTTRDYLWRYRAAVLEREDADNRIAKFETKYKSARSQQGTGMPTSHDTEHDLSDYLTGREELIDFFLAKQSECFAVEVDIHKRIDMIEGKDAQAVTIPAESHLLIYTSPLKCGTAHRKERTLPNVVRIKFNG